MVEKLFPTEKTFRTLYIVGGVLLLISVVLDSFKLSWIPVPSVYPGTVFAAICTIVSLGIAAASIIIGALDRKVLGFAIRDILPRVSVLNMKLSITVLFGTIIIGFLAFSFDCCTTLGTLLLFDCIYMITLSWAVWQIAANEKYMEAMILEDVDKKQNHIETMECWLSELRDAVCERNDQKQEKYIDLIRAYLGKLPSGTSLEFFPGHIKSVFQMAIPEIGFARAYNKVLCLNDSNNKKLQALYDRDSIVMECVDELQYLAADKIAEYRITQIVYDIVKELSSDDETKSSIINRIFTVICKNRTISDEARMNLAKSIIKQVTAFHWNKNTDTYCLIYKYVFKSFVLENDNQKERELLFSYILQRLISMLQPLRHHEEGIIFLAESFRALYFYSKLEKQLLTEEFRDQLINLFILRPISKDNNLFSLSDLVQKHTKELLCWYMNELVDTTKQRDSFFEYYPRSMTFYFKDVIWSAQNRLLFVFLLYLSTHIAQAFSLREQLEKSQLSINDRIKYVDILVCFYNEKQGEIELDSTVSAALSDYKKITGLHAPIHKHLLKRDYNNANALRFELYKQRGDSIVTNTINRDMVIDKVRSIFDSMVGVNLDENVSFENAKQFGQKPELIRKEEVSDDNVANTLIWNLITRINEIIEQVINAEQVDFSIIGVKKMLSLIAQNNFQRTNCQFCNDLALADDVRQSVDFIKLQDVLQTIHGKIDDQIYRTLFLRKEIAFNYRINVLNIGGEVTKELCDSFLENSKISDGKYRVNGILCDYNQAVELLNSNYCVEEYELEIATNITKELGVAIDYI